MLRSAGSQPFKLVCDAEQSIMAVAQAVVDDLSNGSVLRRAPVGSHQSIGGVERYHQDLHGQCRALRAELEKKLGKSIPVTSSLYA